MKEQYCKAIIEDRLPNNSTLLGNKQEWY